MSKDEAVKATNSAVPETPEKEGKAKKADANKSGKPAKDKNKVGFFKRIARFFREVKSEFKKIVWLSKKQILNNTIVVVVFMLIVAVGVWLLDFGFINLFQLIY